MLFKCHQLTDFLSCFPILSSMSKPPNRSAMRRPNTANTLAGGIPVAPVPPFRSRRTLAEYVHDSMHFSNRLSLSHRFAMVSSNSSTKTREELKQILESKISDVNTRLKASEQISGIIVLYPAYTLMVLTASDRSFGLFKDMGGELFFHLFVNGRVLYFHGNVNQVCWDSYLFVNNLLSNSQSKAIYTKSAVSNCRSTGRDHEKCWS